MRTSLLFAALYVGGVGVASAGGEAGGEKEEGVLGPLVSEVSEDGFTLRIGASDRPPAAASLQVFDGKSRPGPTTKPLTQVQSKEALFHDLRVTGLSPGRRYRYRLQLGESLRTDGEVATAPPLGSSRPVVFAVFGDERGSDSWVSPYAEAVVKAVVAEAPDFVVATGDMVAEGGSSDGWRQLARTHRPLFAQMPYLPALGNHELIGDPQARGFLSLFPRAHKGYYAVRYGQILLLFLNGNRPGDPEQSRFLDEELGRAKELGIRRRFVVLHQSPFSTASHCGIARIMAPWIERFERHQVDAVFSGHDHVYQRLERNGIAYFVSGGGGAPLYEGASCAQSDRAALQRFESAHHYLLVQVDPKQDPGITVTARAPSGPAFDKVVLPLSRAQTVPPLVETAPVAEASEKAAPTKPVAAANLDINAKEPEESWAWYAAPAPILLAGWYVGRRARRARRAMVYSSNT